MKDKVTKPANWRGFDDEVVYKEFDPAKHVLPDTIEVVTKRSIPFQLVEYVLCSAWEGGSNYWASCVDSNHRQIGCDYTFQALLHPQGQVRVLDMETNEVHDIGLEQTKKGLAIMADKYPKHMNDMINENFDAITGDVLLQCIVFGDVIYG